MNIPKRLTDEEYDFIFDRIPRLSIDLVITSKDGVLLSLRDIEPYKGLWHLPGGMVYKDEAVDEAAQRIAKKETGLDIEIGDFLGYIEYIHAIQDGHDRHTVSIVLDARAMSEDLKTDRQATQIRFYITLPEHILPLHREFLRDQKHLHSLVNFG